MQLPTDQTALNRLRIGSARRNTGISTFEKRQRAFGIVYMTEIDYGSQLVYTTDGRIYIVLGQTNEILPMPAHNKGGERVFSYLFKMYGLEKLDPMTNFIYENMRSEAINNGLRAELRRFAAYNPKTITVYLSNYDGRMWRIDGESTPTLVRSGEDGVFFIDDDKGTPVEPDFDPDTDEQTLVEQLTRLSYEVGPGGITAEQQQRFMIVWLFAHAFPDLLPDKPIMLLEGEKGSGKTLAPIMIQHVLMGSEPKAMSISEDQERDFGVLLLRAPIAILDNMDSYMEWIQNKICQYATQGTFPRRKLFSDDEEIIVKPKSFIAITSRNPSSFRRDDVVDRLLIVRLKRYEMFRAVEKLMSEIQARRPKLYGEYMFHVGRIITALREGQLEDRNEKWRMASFAAFTRLVGKVFEWPEAEIDAMLDAMQNERDIFEGEGDPLVEIMQEWISYKERGAPSNIGREFSLTELFQIYSNIAKAKTIPFYKHQNRLADRLVSNYVARHFKVEVRNNEATGSKFYRIWRITDPVLSIVEEEPLELEPKIVFKLVPKDA